MGGHLTAGGLPVWLGLTSLAVPKVRAEEKARAPLSPGIAAGLPVLRWRVKHPSKARTPYSKQVSRNRAEKIPG